MQSDYAVDVPVTIASLTQDQQTSLQEARDAIFQSDDEDGHSLSSGIADCFLFKLMIVVSCKLKFYTRQTL